MLSRPRTRGDLPPPARLRVDQAQSSPHARGSSADHSVRSPDRTVVPARAGIFRGTARGAVRAYGRPRTRGDLPAVGGIESAISMSSPHARGSSACPDGPQGRARVVPARAGIFLSTRCRCSHPDGRPRTRGDLPIVPRPSWRLGSRRRPRTRGDLPGVGRFLSVVQPSSPHARGSSAIPTPWTHPLPVVPARAGIFPDRGRLRPDHRSRPRTRGDLPAPTGARSAPMPSSPHARGSSSSEPGRHHPRPVVPARAGIFPTSW